MHAVKNEDTLRKAIRKFVQDGSPKNLMDALKDLHRDDNKNDSQPTCKQSAKK